MALVPYNPRKRGREVARYSGNSLSSGGSSGNVGKYLKYVDPRWLFAQGGYLIGGDPVRDSVNDLSNLEIGSIINRAKDRDVKFGGVVPGVQRGLGSIGNAMRSAIRGTGSALGYKWKDTPMTVGELETGVKNPFAQPRLGLPAGPPRRPVINANQPRMKRDYRLNTTGNYGGRFVGRKRRKISKAAYAGCVLKAERSGSVTDPACVYVGHVAAPLYQTLRCIGWSIARLVAKYWRQDFSSFLAPMNGPDATSSVSIRVTLITRNSPTGICVDHTWTDTSSTWAEFGDNIIHHIISNCSTSDIFYEVVRIKFANIDATAVESLQTIVLHGDQLKIAVSGFSHLKVQNHTVSTAADTLASENKDDIANNPIVGKQYFGKGHYHSYKFNNDYTTLTPTFYYNTDTGYLTMQPNTATSLESNMKNFLDKPPSYKAWTNMNAQRSVKLMPGQIKSSTVKSRYKFSVNQWIKVLFPTFRNATSLSGVSSATSSFAKISKNSILGFEHMLYSSSEPDIVVGYQIDCVTTGIATHKKKMYCVPDFQSATNSLIVEEAPAIS